MAAPLPWTERGYLFNFTAEFIWETRRLVAPRRFGVLVENVEMTQADAAAASKALACEVKEQLHHAYPPATRAQSTSGVVEERTRHRLIENA